MAILQSGITFSIFRNGIEIATSRASDFFPNADNKYNTVQGSISVQLQAGDKIKLKYLNDAPIKISNMSSESEIFAPSTSISISKQ